MLVAAPTVRGYRPLFRSRVCFRQPEQANARVHNPTCNDHYRRAPPAASKQLGRGGRGNDNGHMRHRKPDVPPDDELDQLIRGVGMVCIAASGLEWTLTFLMGEVENWGDEKMRTVLARLNREKAPAQQFRKLARRLVLRVIRHERRTSLLMNMDRSYEADRNPSAMVTVTLSCSP